MTDATSSPTRGSTTPGPQAIYVIRHGEKPTDPKGSDDDPADAVPDAPPIGPPFGVNLNGKVNNHSLIPQGWQRAGAMATLFDPPDHVFANPLLATPTLIAVPRSNDSVKEDDHRAYQTVLPLALRRSSKPTPTVAVGKETKLAAWAQEQTGQVVLVCWEHQGIVTFLDALAELKLITSGSIPKAWEKHRYDLVVAVTPDATGFTCNQVPQLLLAGDSADLLPSKPVGGAV